MSERGGYSMSSRSLLCNAALSEAENDIERNYLAQYKNTLALIESEQNKLADIREKEYELSSKNGITPSETKTLSELYEEGAQIANRISTYDRQLLDLESTTVLKNVIERERAILLKSLEQKGKEAIRKKREEKEKEAQRLLKQFNEQRQERLNRMNQQKQEPPKKQSNKQDNQVKHPLYSKRIAVIISLLICVTLYLLILTTTFTTERDTYICYTTKTGECFHSATCHYISKSAYETTVYEACRDYKPCNYCNPCVAQYKTTILERDYIIPIIISVPISTAVFFLLPHKKKN